MDVKTLRFRAAKGDIEIPGIKVEYPDLHEDVDFKNDEGRVVAWVLSIADDDAEVCDTLHFFDNEKYRTEEDAIKLFFGKQPKKKKKPARMPMTLTINRSGEFVAHHTASTENQCGKPGARHYRYFVTISASNEKLTHQGFVMENLWIEQYFREKFEENGESCGSCEDIAQDAVDYFLNKFATESELDGVNFTRVYVRIHGSDVSFIEAEWKSV